MMRYVLFLSLLFITFSSFSQKGFVAPACFNSPGDDFGVRIIDGKVYLISEAVDSAGVKIKDRTSSHNFTDIYEVNDCKCIDAKLLSKEFGKAVTINSSWYDGPMSYDSQDSIVFFSNTSEGLNHGKMGIYWSKKMPDGTYTNPSPFVYNSSYYSCIHPFYDDATDYLYFAADRDSSNFDLFRISFKKEVYGELELLDSLNSKKDDLFPVVKNGALYFTSNRENGFGGMDIYKSTDLKNSTILDEPVNSKFDDLAIYFLTETRGYVSSNRLQNGSSKDDVFEFYIPKQKVIKEIEVNDNTQLISELENMLIELEKSNDPKALIIKKSIEALKEQQAQIVKLKSDLSTTALKMMNFVDTSLSISFEDKIKVYEQIIASEYAQTTAAASSTSPSVPNSSIAMNTSQEAVAATKALFEKINKNEAVGQFLQEYKAITSTMAADANELSFIKDTIIPFVADNDHLNLKPIVERLNLKNEEVNSFLNSAYPVTFYFDFDRTVIKKDEEERVNFIANIVNNSETGTILVEGHTDSKGNEEYNQKLSMKRANAVYHYLVKNGINKDKIKVVGYGETKPADTNKTKIGRSLNRRVVVTFTM